MEREREREREGGGRIYDNAGQTNAYECEKVQLMFLSACLML